MKINVGFFIIKIEESKNKHKENLLLTLKCTSVIVGFIAIARIVPYLQRMLNFILIQYDKTNNSPESNIILAYIGIFLCCYIFNTITNIIYKIIKTMDRIENENKKEK